MCDMCSVLKAALAERDTLIDHLLKQPSITKSPRLGDRCIVCKRPVAWHFDANNEFVSCVPGEGHPA